MSELVRTDEGRIFEIADRAVARFSETTQDASQVAREWRETFEGASTQAPDTKVVHHFSSEEVYDALFDYYVADLDEDQAIFRARIAKINRAQAMVRLESALAEFDGYFLNKDRGEHINPRQLTVVQPDRKAQYKRIVSITDRIARELLSEIILDAADEAHMSACSDYYTDLVNLLEEPGASRRKVVIRIIESSSFAQSILESRSAPKPLQFLAKCVVLTTPQKPNVDHGEPPGHYLECHPTNKLEDHPCSHSSGRVGDNREESRELTSNGTVERREA